MKTSWIETDLSKLIETIESGGRPKGGVSEDSGEIPSLGGENIVQTGGVDTKKVKKIPTVYFEKMNKGILEDQDVLINKDGANTGKVGLYKKVFPEAAINEHLFLIRGYEERLTQEYLFYLLLSDDGQQKIRAKITGSAQPGLKQDFVKSFPVLVPDLISEQKSITDVLSTIDQAITHTEALIAKYQRTKTSMMQDLLARGIDENGEIRDPTSHKFKPSPLGMIPNDWDTLPLVEFLLARPQNGIYKPSKDIGQGYLLVGQTAIDQERIVNFSLARRVRINSEELARFGLETGNILISRVFATVQGVGRPAYVSGMPEQAVFESNMMKLEINNSKIHPYILFYWLQSKQSRKYIVSRVNASNQVSINQANLCSLPVILIPKKEQRKIVNTIAAVDEALKQNKDLLNKYIRLKIGLMQDLLNGKVSIAPLIG